MKTLSKEAIYKKNQKLAKRLGVLSPICFWGLLALSFLCFSIAIKNSLGNIKEITDLLDTKSHTGQELNDNYTYLVEKYGEWVIGNGDNGFQLVFINIKKAVFSGIMIANGVMFIVFLISSYLLGKWLLPALKDRVIQENQDMCNLELLKISERV